MTVWTVSVWQHTLAAVVAVRSALLSYFYRCIYIFDILLVDSSRGK